jgi:hypothetical protein
MRAVRTALAAGLTLLVIAIGLTLLQSPTSVAHTNGTPSEEEVIAITSRGASYCQAGELLPRDTTAIRLSLSTFTGPRVTVLVSSGGHRITSGERASGWTSRVVTVPVKPLARAVTGVTVCVSFQLQNETLTVFGKFTPSAVAARSGQQTLPGRMWVEYLRPGRRSWASLAPSIARHFGFGRAAAGTWIAFLAIALLAAVAILTSRLVLEDLA